MKGNAMITILGIALRLPPCLALVIALPLTPTSGARSAPAQVIRGQAAPSWLAEINLYRKAAGVSPVVDQPAWDSGLRRHFRYLALTPKRYFTGQYQSLHTENPRSPYYTKAGAMEAGASDLLEGDIPAGGVQVIDWWLRAPFHATGMLRPNLRRVAFAYAASARAAGLDVISGLVYGMQAPKKPTLFPGPGVTTDLTTFLGGESPNPLETCGWSTAGPYGLPLIALLTQNPSAGLSASLTGPAGVRETSGEKNLCIVDDNTYRSSDAVYGPTGKQILTVDHAVYLFPRLPLRPGAYQVSIIQLRQAAVRWSFHVRAGSGM